ncbi:MAG: ribosome maturation factor RimM [Parvularculaceae bacterium]
MLIIWGSFSPFNCANTAAMEKMICIAALAGAHGVKGDAKLRSFTQTPADFASYGALKDEAGKVYEIKIVREAKPALFIIAAALIKTREQAEALKGTKLYVPRSALPPPERDEFYHEDLVGLIGQTPDGAPFGKIKAVVNHGAGDLLEIINIPQTKGSVMVTFTKQIVPEINFDSGIIIIDLPPEQAGEPEHS